MGCHFLLQGIFPIQESNLSFLHLLRCRQIRYHSATWEAKERRKSPSLWLFTNSYHSIVCRGREADCPSQSRAGSSRVYKKFSFTCYIKGDPRLHWGNESGSNEINSQAGTQAPSVGVWDQLIHKWGCVNFVCVCVCKMWDFIFLILFLLYFALQYCIGFAIHWHESATGVTFYWTYYEYKCRHCDGCMMFSVNFILENN